MHNSKIPEYIKERVIKRRGKLNIHEKINPKTTALSVSYTHLTLPTTPYV